MPSVALSLDLPTSTVTVLSTAKVVEPPSVAVTRTVFAPPPSETDLCAAGVSVSASTVSVRPVGAASSSVMVTAAALTVGAPAPLTAPLTLIDSFPSWIRSLTGVSVNVPALAVAPTGIVMLKPVTTAKSSVTVAVPLLTVTATVCATP